MPYAHCCTKPSVALAHFVVRCISKPKQYNHEHYEKNKEQPWFSAHACVPECRYFGMQACAKVAGFQKAYNRLEKKIIVSGKSLSTLDTMEFIRRFSLHILPKGFMRIRHYGILSSSRKQKTLPLIHDQLNSLYMVPEKKDWKQISTVLGFNPDCCPVCKQQTMITLLSFDRRGPPDDTFIRSLKEKVLASHS